MRIALFEPDIPPNAATILRLGACLGVSIDIIEPCGFALSDRGFRRAGLDYLAQADVTRHRSWACFLAAEKPGRIILLSTKATMPHTDFSFRPNDILLLGRETAGVPDHVRKAADHEVTIPMVDGARSLNVAIAGAIVLGEALRQTGQYPADRSPGLAEMDRPDMP